jgi:hypothetical protein
MKQFQLLTDGDLPKMRVVASTRAGFMTACLEGVFSLSKPQFSEKDEDARLVNPDSEREFKVQAESFPSLLAAFLNDALKQAQARNEAYVGVRLSLITDKQAEGAFLGQPISGWGRKLRSVIEEGLSVEKNQLGYWESTVSFRE